MNPVLLTQYPLIRPKLAQFKQALKMKIRSSYQRLSLSQLIRGYDCAAPHLCLTQTRARPTISNGHRVTLGGGTGSSFRARAGQSCFAAAILFSGAFISGCSFQGRAGGLASSSSAQNELHASAEISRDHRKSLAPRGSTETPQKFGGADPAGSQPKTALIAGAPNGGLPGTAPRTGEARAFSTRDGAESPREGDGKDTGARGTLQANLDIELFKDVSARRAAFKAFLQGLSGKSSLPSHRGEVLALAINSPLGLAISVGKDGAVLVWRPAASAAQPIWRSPVELELATIEPERGLLAYWAKHRLVVVDLVTGAELAQLSRIDSRLTSLAFQPGGCALLAAGADGRPYRWKFFEDSHALGLERYFGPATVLSAVAWHPAGRVFFTGDWDGGLNAWLPHDEDIHHGTYDENLFINGIFSERSARQKAARQDSVSITHLIASGDGQWLYVGLQDGRVEWWMIRGLKKLGDFSAGKGALNSLALSPDGTELVTLGREGTLKVFRLAFQDVDPPTVTFTPIAQKVFAGARNVVFLDQDRLWVGDASGHVLSFKTDSGTISSAGAPGLGASKGD